MSLFLCVLAFALGTRGAHAAPDAYAEYEGAMSDGGVARLVVNADRTAIEAFFIFSSPPPGCPVDAHFPAIPIGDDDSFRADAVRTSSQTSRGSAVVQTASAIGFWDVRYLVASGALAVDPAPGQPCPSRRVSWRAGWSNGAPSLGGARSTAFVASGSVYAAGSREPGGAVQVSTTEFGSGVASLSFTFQQGACSYAHALSAPRYYYGSPSFEFADPGVWAVSGVPSVAAMRGGIMAVGHDACPTVALYYVAVVPPPSSRPEPPAVRAASTATLPPGTFVAPPVFDETFTAQVVFTGGSARDLEGALLIWNAASASVVDAEGIVRRLEIRGSRASLEAFAAHFPDGIPPMTPVTLTR